MLYTNEDVVEFEAVVAEMIDSLAATTISTAEVATICGTCIRTVRRWCEAGKLLAFQNIITREWYISRSFFERNKTELKKVVKNPRRGGQQKLNFGKLT